MDEPEFDPLIHSPARLKIVMLLAASSAPTFPELLRDTRLTTGNLASHLRALEAAGYVESWKALVELRPRTRHRLTDAGREALRAYCEALAATVEGIQRLMARPGDGPATRSG